MSNSLKPRERWLSGKQVNKLSHSLPSIKKISGQKMSRYHPALRWHLVPVLSCDLFTNTIPFSSSRKTVLSTVISWKLSMASQALCTPTIIQTQSLSQLYPKLLVGGTDPQIWGFPCRYKFSWHIVPCSTSSFEQLNSATYHKTLFHKVLEIPVKLYLFPWVKNTV